MPVGDSLGAGGSGVAEGVAGQDGVAQALGFEAEAEGMVFAGDEVDAGGIGLGEDGDGFRAEEGLVAVDAATARPP